MADMLKLIAPVELQAAAEVEGESGKPKRPTFSIVAYTGAAMNVDGFFSPVVIELSGVKTTRNEIPILLDHDSSKIIGQGSAKVDTAAVRIDGEVMGEDADATKVMALAKNGFKWQASIGAVITRREFLEAGKKAVVNGREVSGPMIIARESILKETSFVAIGADDQTSAAVAASQSGKGANVNPEFKAWLEAKGFTATDNLTAQQVAFFESAWKAETGQKPRESTSVDKVIADAKAETERRQNIAELTAQALHDNPTQDAVAKIEALAAIAIEAKWSFDKYELELLRAGRPQAPSSIFRPALNSQLNNRVVEAAICQAGRLENYEKAFDDQTLQAAHDRFKGKIGLKQLFLLCAEANGYRGDYSSDVTIDVQRHAFGMTAPNRIQASGWSSLVIATILSNTANKFLMDGWNAVDSTPLRVASIRPVRNFQQITTVSLTGALQFEKLGAAGEIKHGTLGEVTYTNKADTYAKMLAVTRQDIINDDLGALTAVPRRLGRGAALALNDIFWTEFLNNSSFFSSGNSNVNTGAADMTVAGLAATETIFMNQTDPDGKPLGIMPAILLVPTALKPAATTLMTSERLITGASATLGDGNIWRDRFRVESSPYMSNSSYTGYDAAAWYMLASPSDLPVIEIVALNGRVEPVVETADADFNVLGVQMRGYSDIGVNLQEYRAGVRADGGAS